MPHIDGLILAEGASIVDHKVFMLGGGIDRIQTPAVPVLVPVLAACAFVRIGWMETNTPYEVTLDVVDADGHSVLPDGMPKPTQRVLTGRPAAALVGQDLNVPLAFTLVGLTCQAFGTYAITVHLNGQEVARAPFHIVYAKAS